MSSQQAFTTGMLNLLLVQNRRVRFPGQALLEPRISSCRIVNQPPKYVPGIMEVSPFEILAKVLEMKFPVVRSPGAIAMVFPNLFPVPLRPFRVS